MAPRLIVLNEWLFHDLQGENGGPAQEESRHFLSEFIVSEDRLAVVGGSPWWFKACKLMGSHGVWVSRSGGLIKSSILQNSVKCELLWPQEIEPLPDSVLALQLGEEEYLLQTYFSARANLIVTSDVRLIEKVRHLHEIKIAFRDDLLREYFLP